ncbi:MAG: DUF6519 domain-containing protein [bacterium]
MSGDFSRKTFDKKKHYSGVLMQQGRVQLDADWNEQLEIHQHRTETEAKDVIGRCGVPKKEDGFKIDIFPDGSDLTISPGRIYVDGLLCELEITPAPTTYFNQPYYPNPDDTHFMTSPPGSPTAFPPANLPPIPPPNPRGSQPSLPPANLPPIPPMNPPTRHPMSPPGGYKPVNLQDGTYLIYLDAWQREISFLDDPRIHEVALGEADTTMRVQNVWQVKLLPVTPGTSGETTCKTPFPEWDKCTAGSTGMLNVKTKEAEDQKKPCLLPPSAGYRRLENQLYRIEIQTGGTRDNATFKWSRDNGSVETKIKEIEGHIVTVSDIGKDEVLGFAGGQWVEIVDEESTLKNLPNQLRQIEKVDPETHEITMKTSVAAYKNKQNLKLRRWDQTSTPATCDGVKMSTDWIDLEDGIQIQFSEGTYQPGDHWLIPARATTGEIEWPPYEIPNKNPIPQPPLGILHRYCPLALIDAISGFATLKDCREVFPTLTEICAEDVCFDNSISKFPGAETVQDALDWLSAARDLPQHNKYLHGHGVVCGLKVTCSPDREKVIIEKGYALNCEGYGIHVQNEFDSNVVREAERNGLLDHKGDGRVCLTIEGNASEGAKILVKPYVQKSFWDNVLEGTLLKDFYEDYIEILIFFLGQQFPKNLTDTPPVPLTQRRLTAFINLLWQLLNSANGPYVFLSGRKDRTEDCGDDSDESRYEDKLIWCFYNLLKTFLASETYCAMFDKDRPFPDYNIDPGLETIFGPSFKFHQRLRIHPSRNLAYTCGSGNKIYVYDLEAKELIQTLVFPSSTNIHVQDVAILRDGSTLYAVGILDDKDSVFAVVEIAEDGTNTWRTSSVKCGMKFVRLAMGPAPSNKLYAIGKAKGLYRIEGIGLPSFSATLIHEFNATGLLKLSDDGTQAFAAANSSISPGTESSSFDQIIKIELETTAAPPLKTYQLTGNDQENDIALHNNMMYVTGDPAGGQTKTLWGFNISTTQAEEKVDLLKDTLTRITIAPDTSAGDFLLVTLADRYMVGRIDLKDHTFDDSFRIPVQVYPVDIVISSDGQTGYVLNSPVNTITEIDMNTVCNSLEAPPNFTMEPPIEMSDYHQDVIHAFSDLISHFFQYLKDGFCDKFLVDCPECGVDDEVYLGSVTIRGRKVHNICNLTKRHYVKSFRTWGYWLSAVPILPLIKSLLSKFCCSIIEFGRTDKEP